MDKVRKISSWIWNNKERMIFAIMVLILCYRVYRVVQPPKAPDAPNHTFPRQVPEDPEEMKAFLSEMNFPGSPPAPPDVVPMPPSKGLSERNPFWYYSQRADNKNDDEAKIQSNIKLVRISQGKDNKLRAQIKTASSSKWFYEGDSFESFQLLSINEEQKSCEVYSEQLKKKIVLNLQSR